MSEIESPDFDYAKELAGGSDDILLSIIDAFLEEAPALVLKSDAALKERDASEFNKAIHALKSNVRVFGVPNSFALAETLEQTSREGDLSRADESFETLRVQVVSMTEVLIEYLANRK